MGILLACGSNASGQLAIGSTEDVAVFTPCQFDPSSSPGEVVSVVSAAAHALVLRQQDGEVTLLGAGTNTHGQLGAQCALSKEQPRKAFRPISLARDAGLEHWQPVMIAATWTTSFVVFERAGRQRIVAAGSNDFGELGTGGAGKAGIQEVDVGLRDGERISLIRGGQRHVLVVIEGETRQRVVGWGASRRGELSPQVSQSKKGKGPTLPAVSSPVEVQLDLPDKIVDIALGASHSVVRTGDGGVRAWGSDAKGQVAGLTAPSSVQASAIAATWGGTYLVQQGQVWSQGSNTHSQLLRTSSSPRGLVQTPAGVATIAAGSEHILATTTQHRTLSAGGWNEHGNLGVGDVVDRAELVPVTLNGSVRAIWGGCAASWVLLETGGDDATA